MGLLKIDNLTCYHFYHPSFPCREAAKVVSNLKIFLLAAEAVQILQGIHPFLNPAHSQVFTEREITTQQARSTEIDGY